MDAQNLTPIRAMDEASVEFRYGMGGDTEKEFIESSDMGQLQGSELESKRQLEREYNVPEKTIADETLGDIMKNTLDFLTYSGDNYMKKVYEAEEIFEVDVAIIPEPLPVIGDPEKILFCGWRR